MDGVEVVVSYPYSALTRYKTADMYSVGEHFRLPKRATQSAAAAAAPPALHFLSPLSCLPTPPCNPFANPSLISQPKSVRHFTFSYVLLYLLFSRETLLLSLPAPPARVNALQNA